MNKTPEFATLGEAKARAGETKARAGLRAHAGQKRALPANKPAPSADGETAGGAAVLARRSDTLRRTMFGSSAPRVTRASARGASAPPRGSATARLRKRIAAITVGGPSGGATLASAAQGPELAAVVAAKIAELAALAPPSPQRPELAAVAVGKMPELAAVAVSKMPELGAAAGAKMPELAPGALAAVAVANGPELAGTIADPASPADRGPTAPAPAGGAGADQKTAAGPSPSLPSLAGPDAGRLIYVEPVPEMSAKGARYLRPRPPAAPAPAPLSSGGSSTPAPSDMRECLGLAVPAADASTESLMEFLAHLWGHPFGRDVHDGTRSAKVRFTYGEVLPSGVRTMLRRLSCHDPLATRRLVDLGAGQGRFALQAWLEHAHLDRVDGVEYSRQRWEGGSQMLRRLAEANPERYSCTRHDAQINPSCGACAKWRCPLCRDWVVLEELAAADPPLAAEEKQAQAGPKREKGQRVAPARQLTLFLGDLFDYPLGDEDIVICETAIPDDRQAELLWHLGRAKPGSRLLTYHELHNWPQADYDPHAQRLSLRAPAPATPPSTSPAPAGANATAADAPPNPASPPPLSGPATPPGAAVTTAAAQRPAFSRIPSEIVATTWESHYFSLYQRV
jgi:hypothetical protein